jgi:hypothetical protein
MVKPTEEVSRMVRTVIEAADPALRPVANLRRFVVKRIEFVGTPPTDRSSKPSRKAGTASGPSQRQASRSAH